MPLTDIACRKAQAKEKGYKLSDSGGLFLWVAVTRHKSWKLKYRIAGVEKKETFGSYPQMSLGEARTARDNFKKLLKSGLDPVEVKRNEKNLKLDAQRNTFESFSRDWHARQLDGWSERHGKYVLRRLELDVFPEIGSRPISQIKSKDIIALLRKMEARGVKDLPRRTKQTLNQIFRNALVEEFVTANPIAFESRDVLKPFTPGHYAALDHRDLPEFLYKLERNDGRLYPHTRLAAKLMVNVFLRTSELIKAEWSEIDLESATWYVPASRMKMKESHLVPLSQQAMEMLLELRSYRTERISQSFPDYIFPNQQNPRTHMSNNTLLKAIANLGYKGLATGHGFRATAMSTIKQELKYRHEVIDRQLAHKPRSKVDKAYDRAEFFDERRLMMQDWSNYLDKVLKAHQLKKAAAHG